jgi:DNA-binding Lrp family transcriptional regulator
LERKLFSELLKDSRKSDGELATILGVSRPTITRMLTRLVNAGMVQDFTVIPDFAKTGYELMAIISYRLEMERELAEKTARWTMSKPNVIFAARAEGMGKNRLIVSVHKNYTCYSNFLTDLRLKSGNDLQDMDTLLISLKEEPTKPFSLKYLAELEETK